jgi:hypothetical protein
MPGSRSAATRAALWPVMPWTFAAAIVTAELKAGTPAPAASRLEAAWLWFRDHWGVVWALRVLERFNRSAEANRWPIRLSWPGVAAVGGEAGPPSVPAAAEATFAGLIRRFAEPWRVDQEAGAG